MMKCEGSMIHVRQAILESLVAQFHAVETTHERRYHDGPGGPNRALVPHERRTQPVRDRQFRRSCHRNGRADNRLVLRRVRALSRRDVAQWRVRNADGIEADRRDRFEKPLNRREWRFLDRVAAGPGVAPLFLLRNPGG